MRHTPQVDDPPPSAFSEPSEPSQVTPGEKDKALITSAQEENPQVVVKKDPETAKQREKDAMQGGKSKL